MTTKTYHRSVCPLDCPDTCSLLVEKENGKITKVDGNPDHPVTKGMICHKVRKMPERTHHPERLLHPMKRIGKKGGLSFERITWDEAYEEIISRFKAIMEEYGSEAILPYSFYGNMGIINSEGMDRRFFYRLGARKLERTICNTAGSEGYQITMGKAVGIDPEETVHSKLIVIWGCNLISTNLHQVIYANKARKKGAKIVVVDIHRNRTAKWADHFYQIKPGSDDILALGIMHIIIKNDWIDEKFLDQYTNGFESLKERAMEYPPDKVAGLTGLHEEQLMELAQMYGTISPSFIRIGNGLQHQKNGGRITRLITCLPALTGQWGKTGGGALKGNSRYAEWNMQKVQRPDMHPDSDVRSTNMNQIGMALQEKDDPIKALFIYNSNPAQVAPNQKLVRKGLMRDDLFTVVHDLFPTDSCRYADIVLPATSHFENLDLYKSYWHLYVQLNEPVMDPIGECKSNFTLFKEMAAGMGFTEQCFQDTEEDMIRDALDNPGSPYLSGLTLDQLKRDGWVKLKLEKETTFPEKIPTSSGRIELSSPADDQLFNMEKDEKRDYPLQLISGPNHQFLNSIFSNLDSLQALEKPVVYIHPSDAEDRNLQTGDFVEVFNELGTVHLQAEITEDVSEGVLITQGLWWDDEEKERYSINHLTPDGLSDIGGGATFFNCFVGIKKA
ncbi:molybdopterin-containing oxidoreductase family protein [Pseudalkalibacillus salsuginis]|uniref:molybdopterin-containing oxidoreductase family protein n=1 Tax=Pseudalkalibacillus salsuginis TaxID=2910972 RepID=UPI001F39140E|nr:molybdopterin oxidoreductase family protein [Pseudalkalibacillus salsuginis]MCF6409331.1 molybdopterin oxidoreductase family protein [Pseudalkalibacillus salsuginis]